MDCKPELFGTAKDEWIIIQMEDEPDSISDALLRKEKELQHIAKLRIAQLQEQVTLKDELVSELQQRLKRICEDFNYNFQLIEERDRELHSFEQQAAALSSALKAKDADLSDLRRALQTKEDDYKADIDYLKQQLDDCQESIEVSKSREAQFLQQEAEFSLRLESAEKAIRDKDRELSKSLSMVESLSAALEKEKYSAAEQLDAEREKWEEALELERQRTREVEDEHMQCAMKLKDYERRLRDETNNLQMLNAAKDGQLEDAEKRLRILEAEKTELGKEIQRIKKDKETEISEVRSRMVEESQVEGLREQIRILQDNVAAAKIQKTTLEEVISSLERELDLERKERAKDRRVIREAQTRLESETHFAIEKNAQWQTIAESRAEEMATARVKFIQRNLVQAEEQARHFEREFLRAKKALELEATRHQEEVQRSTALQAQVAVLERDKARVMAELRLTKVAETREVQGGRRESQTVGDVPMRESLGGETQREAAKTVEKSLLSPSYQHFPKRSQDRFPSRKDSTLDTVPSRDPRILVGLKQRIAQVKDQLETEFQTAKTATNSEIR